MILSQVARIYYSLGLITPVTLNAKLLVRNLVYQKTDKEVGKSNSFGWDDPISGECRNAWKRFFIDLFKLQDVVFCRCVKPQNAIGLPTLIIFSDASGQAFGACALGWFGLYTFLPNQHAYLLI